MSNRLKPCPKCGAKVKLYSHINPHDNFCVLARCTNCKEEYPIPNVKIRTWKSNPTRISKRTIQEAEEAWNRRVAELYDIQAKSILCQLEEVTGETEYGEPQAFLDLPNGAHWKSHTKSMGYMKRSSITPGV